MSANGWSRGDKIALLSLLVAIVTCIVALLIPETRHWLGLDSNENSKEKQIVEKPIAQPTPSTTSNYEPKSKLSEQTSTTPNPQTTFPPTQSQPTRQTEPILNIGGVWRDVDYPSNITRITQDGNRFQFAKSGIVQGGTYETLGSGLVTGQSITLHFNAEYSNGFKQSGDCTGTLSPDGRILTWRCTDTTSYTFAGSMVRQ